MHSALEPLVSGFALSGNIPQDVVGFLNLHGCEKTTIHCAEVAEYAQQLALRFGYDGELALQAGWLHDVSAVIPVAERVWYARNLGLDILAEEIQLPMILHQKLSRAFAHEIFGVDNIAVLEAIECHTTLKRGAKQLDKILFVADKVAWDQSGTPPYAQALACALEQSLDSAVCVYLTYLWQQRESLPVIHPWFVGAVENLCAH